MQDALLQEGDSLLHYRILSRLGEGGMGAVYRAEDTRLGRTVALKILRQDRAEDDDWNQRFQREVRVASSFNHPGIATLYDFHRDGDAFFYTMELVEGRNLRDVLATGPLPLPALLDCSLQMAEALREAHRKGVVHRDLKPENVMESGAGYYKILDFGLACFTPEGLAAADSSSLLETIARDTTQPGHLVGTVNYMSPEQAKGTSVDARSDIFAFGSLVYELATGEPPFTRPSAIATFHAIVHEEPDPLTSIRPELPRELGWILSRCLAKDPDRRYPSADELAEDLRALTRSSDSGARAPSRIRPPDDGTPSRWRRWAILAGVVAVVAVVAAILADRPWESGPEPAQRIRATASAPASSDVEPRADRYIAIAPFTNRTGDPEADWLIRGLPEMLTTQLAGAGLKVLSTQRLDDFASTTGRDSLDGATATELARWAGASIAVIGSIYKVREQYRMDAQAYDTGTGQVLTAAAIEGTDVFRIVDELTARIQSGLQVGTDAQTGPQLVGTSSEEAFRHYAEGTRHYAEARYAQSADAFRRSAMADSNFALGRMRLGMGLYLSGEREAGLEWVGRAADGRGQLPDRDALLVEILRAYYEEGDPELAEERLARFADEYPHDQEAVFWKARAAADLDGDFMSAIRELRRSLQEQPDHLGTVVALSDLLAELGMVDDARGLLEDYLARHPGATDTIAEIAGKY